MAQRSRVFRLSSALAAVTLLATLVPMASSDGPPRQKDQDETAKKGPARVTATRTREASAGAAAVTPSPGTTGRQDASSERRGAGKAAPAQVKPGHSTKRGGSGKGKSILRARRLAQNASEPALLLLSRFQFDPLDGEPELPPDQRTQYDPGEAGFFLVQFVGATQDQWLEALRQDGVIIIQFQPTHAYIVRMTPEAAAQVAEHDFVRSVNVYHAAYRIHPKLLEPQVPPPGAGPRPQQEAAEQTDLTIFDDGDVSGALEEIRGLGGQVIQQYPAQADGLLVTAIVLLPAENAAAAAQINTVLWLNPSSPAPEFDDEVADQILAGNSTAGVPFPGFNAFLGTSGVDGTGVRLAVVDSGMDTNASATAHADIAGRIAAFVSYPGAPATDTNGHGTHVGGVVAGNASLGTLDADGFLLGLGMAPAAQLVIQNAVNSGASWPPAGGWQQLSADSVTNGAVASNNSWNTGLGIMGYSGPARTHDQMVRDANFATTGTAEPLIMVFSAGNAGPTASTLTEPKEAKNLIAVGASENLRDDPWVTPGFCGMPSDIADIASFSSRGPCADGRIKPDIVAPGTFISSLRSATGSFGGGVCSGVIDANYVWFSGTSQASPHVTGAVGLIAEWWRARNGGADPSPAMAKALLINGAVDLGTPDVPNGNEGWGRMDVDRVLNPQARVFYRDQSTTFGATGDTWSQRVAPTDPLQPLKITLAWSDAPGAGSGGMTAGWVNDLDLTVAQGGTTFLGNVFAGGVSVTGGAADDRNNVENVFIQGPSAIYDVTVAGSNIAGDGVPANADLTDQDFALVCTNCDLTPLCDANGPYLAECAGPATSVMLDGSGSSDPDGDPLMFTWSGPFAGGSAMGTMPSVDFPGAGAFVVTLATDDGFATETCTADVSIADTTPPTVTCAVTVSMLHPPNHDLVDVGLTLSAADVCAGDLPVSVTVYSDEDELQAGSGMHSPDATMNGARLRAERSGSGDGRVFLLVASATDTAGLSTSDCCTVVVPHDQSAVSRASVAAQAADARATCLATGGPPPGYVRVDDGPVVGPKQ